MSDSQYRWMVLENIATITAAILACYFISGWFALLFLNLNSVKRTKLP